MLKLIKALRPFSVYLLVIWTIFIITVSSIPHLPVLKIQTAGSSIRLDYFIHFCEYGFLAFITYLAFTGKHFNPGLSRYFILTLALLLFATIDELHQKFIPGRTVNTRDLLSNFSGIFAALVFCVPVFRRILKNSISI